MTLTNTDCVGKDWSWYKVWGEAKWPVKKQVNEQVSGYVYDQVYDQVYVQMFYRINPIKYTIYEEIKNEFH